MDLGIAGRRAIVCGSTRGLGYACAASLAGAGVDVLLNGRSDASVQEAVARLSKEIGRNIVGVTADVTQEQGRQAILARFSQPDILVTNAAGPPPGQFESWNRERWMTALEHNMVSPILLIRDALPGMRQRGWGRIINITSSAVKAPLPLLGLSNGARSGLTGFVAGLARDVARDGVTINNLLPGPFATDRLKAYAQACATERGVDFEIIWKELIDMNPCGRVGRPEEFGATCAFLASQHAGYINGQNWLLDGGAFPGTL